MGASQSASAPSTHSAPEPNMALAEVPVEELLAELTRRLECSKKPEKRLILIGVTSSSAAIDGRDESVLIRPLVSCRSPWLWQGHTIAQDQV